MSDINTSYQDSLKGTKLLAFDKAKKIKYFGRCSLEITPVSKFLTLKLYDEASTEMLSTFNRRFFVIGNFLFASDFLTKNDFVIIFTQRSNCCKIFDEIERKKHETFRPNKDLKEEIFKTDFFIPIVREIYHKVDGHEEIKNLLHRIIKTFTGEKKDLYWNLMVETLLSADSAYRECKIEAVNNSNAHQRGITSSSPMVADDVVIKSENNENLSEFSSDDESDGVADNEFEESASVSSNANSDGSDEEDSQAEESEPETQITRKKLRKRPLNLIDSDDEDSSESCCNTSDDERSLYHKMLQIKKKKLNSSDSSGNTSTHVFSSLDPSNYKFVEYTENGKIKKKLLIFTSQDQKKCYQYSYDRGHNHYQCRKCNPQKHYVYVTVAVDDTGMKELTLGKNEHQCEPIDYSPENYTSTKIVKLPGYKLYEKLSKKRMVQRLIVFADKDQKLCYEYSLSDRGFHCMACILLRRYISAKLIKDSDDGDYLFLSRAKHVCNPKKYVPMDVPVKTVQKPYFKILTVINGKGNGRKTLKIFDSDDMSMFYGYYYSKTFECFICSGCSKKQPHRQVSAKLCHDEDGASYIELSKIKHVCSMKSVNSAP